MKVCLFLLVFGLLQDEVVPFKPYNEFTVKAELLTGVKKPKIESTALMSRGTGISSVEGYENSVYVVIFITSLEIQADEKRIIATDSKGNTLVNKRRNLDGEIELDMGILADILSGDDPNAVTLFFISSRRKKLRKIDIQITGSGVLVVNGKWHSHL